MILALIILPVSVASAQDTAPSSSTPSSDTATRQPAQLSDITSCDTLNEAANTTGLVVTIMEEELGGSREIQNLGDSKIMRCYRVTTCKLPRTDGSHDPPNLDKCVKISKYANTCSPNSSTLCQRVQVIVSKTGPALLYTYIGMIYRWAAGVVGIICVLVLIIGGIQVATAGDDQGKIGEAKTRIVQSLAGLAILFLSAIILYTINPNFFTI